MSYVTRTDATLPQRAALAQAVYEPEVLHPVEVGAEQEAHLVKWLSKRLEHKVVEQNVTRQFQALADEIERRAAKVRVAPMATSAVRTGSE